MAVLRIAKMGNPVLLQKAAPVEDAANTRLCRYLAGLFDVPLAAVRLLQGNKSRNKLLAIDGVQALPPVLAALTGPEA